MLFYLLNGYLFGREYFELVAVRRLDREEMKRLWLSRKRQFMLAGVVITFLFSVPIVNLIAPVVGTAFMVHLFQRETVARSRG